jgi:hypothetical protein
VAELPRDDHWIEPEFDYLPVRDADGFIRRLVPTASLATAESWDFLESEAIQ